jgi:ABC-2 type transport system permease protein
MIAKLWAIVRREYLERVRTKGFVIGTVLGPLVLAALMLGPILAMRSGSKPLRVCVLDRTGTLGPRVEDALRTARFDGKPRFDVLPAQPEPDLREAVLDGRLDGYLELPAEAVEKVTASYFGRNVSNRLDLSTMERAVSDVIVGVRVATAGLDPRRVKDLTKELDLKTIRLSESGEREDRGAALMLAIILLMILYTSMLIWGQMVMTSVIEEKSSRVVEVLASGVPATTLLTGKLLGVGAAGLTQFLVWSLCLLAASAAPAALLTFRMPEVTPLVLVSFVLFFLLGFLFYAALYAAIGAAVNTVQEAQNFVWIVMTPILLGMVSFSAAIEAPDGPLSVTLSMIPGISPLIMFLRIVVLTPPVWQIASSIALLALAIVGVLWVSARVYRVGILMYGKKPTFPEIVKWIRHA